MASEEMRERETADAAETVVELDGVTKRYGSLVAADDVSIPIRDGEFLTILGPSGAGKTTLLHMIAGFEQPTEGEIYIDGRAVSNEPPNERDIGLVFQSLALFPHMTVKENIAFPLKMRREDPGDIDRQVAEVLELVRLPADYADKPVGDLSGGQQQRVAFARAIVYEPTLLLLDEPLSSLDKKLREEMRAELARIHDETELTIVHVTHNQTEALSMADRIAVVNDGSIEQLAPAKEVYAHPATPFVAEFIGDTTMVDGTVDRLDDAGGVATVGTGEVVFDGDGEYAVGDAVRLGLRSEKVDVDRTGLDGPNEFDGTVGQVSFEGNQTQYAVEVPAIDATVGATRQDPEAGEELERGDDVVVGWAAADVFAYHD